MRILHIIPYFYPAWAYGGTCRGAWEVARAMARRGHEVAAYTTDALDSRRRAHPAFEIVEGVQIHRAANLSNRLAWRRLFLPLAFGLGLEREIRKADVVHLHEYRSLQNAIALPMIERTRAPFILTAQGGVPLLVGRFALKRFYDSLAGRRLVRGARRLHALNNMEAEQFLDAGGKLEQIFISPNGIDAEEYRESPEADSFRARYNISADAPVVLFLARVHKIKGVDFLVSSFAEASRALPSAVLVIAGPDDGYLPEVKRQVQMLGIEPRVRFTGYIDGKSKLEAYRAANLYVLPSAYEILGITLLESLACGTPVITTDRCGLADALRQKELGSVVAYGDVKGLKEEIVRALSSPAKGAEYRRNYVLQNYGWDKIAEGWEKVYQQCAAFAES